MPWRQKQQWRYGSMPWGEWSALHPRCFTSGKRGPSVYWQKSVWTPVPSMDVIQTRHTSHPCYETVLEDSLQPSACTISAVLEDSLQPSACTISAVLEDSLQPGACTISAVLEDSLQPGACTISAVLEDSLQPSACTISAVLEDSLQPSACTISAVPVHIPWWMFYIKEVNSKSLINPLNPELNPICYLLALLAHHFLHVSRIRVKSLTIRLLMSYIYGAPILDVSRSHTTMQHSR